MNLPGLVGRAFKFVWRDGEIPGRRWLSQVSRWIAGVESQDQSVVVSYHDNGINLSVNRPYLSQNLIDDNTELVTSRVWLYVNQLKYDYIDAGLVMTTGTTDGGAIAYDHIGDTGTGVIIEFDTSTVSDLEPDIRLTTDGYIQTRAKTVGLAVVAATTDEPAYLYVNESSYGNWSSGMTVDFTTEVDLAPESQVTTGGYLQTRMKKVKLGISSGKLAILASTGYGSWVNGPSVGECT
jgi:hypothetical protein